MGMLEKIGHPAPDKDGTLWVKHENKDGVVRLICNGHAFVECKMKDGHPVVQVIDADTGIVFEKDFAILAWRR